MSDLEASVVELDPQPTAAVRVRQSMEELDLGALFELQIPRVAQRLGELGAAPAGAPYARYHEFGPELVDVEIGFPLAAPVAQLAPVAVDESAAVGASELPGGEAALAVHRGPYDTLTETYDALPGWIAARGRMQGAGPWECYVDDPGTVADASQLRTDVYWPLA